MRQHLYNRLQNFNTRVENRYRQDWGSLVLYLPGGHRLVGGEVDEVNIVNGINAMVEEKYKSRRALEEAASAEPAKKIGGGKRHQTPTYAYRPPDPRTRLRAHSNNFMDHGSRPDQL